MINMETIDIIVASIIAAAPAITSIVGIIAAFIKIKKNNDVSNKEIFEKFEEVRAEVINTKEYENLKDQLLLAHKENRELKKQMNELLTKIDHIVRED